MEVMQLLGLVGVVCRFHEQEMVDWLLIASHVARMPERCSCFNEKLKEKLPP